MKKIMSYILNPIKADKEGAAKMNTKIRKGIVRIEQLQLYYRKMQTTKKLHGQAQMKVQ